MSEGRPGDVGVKVTGDRGESGGGDRYSGLAEDVLGPAHRCRGPLGQFENRAFGAFDIRTSSAVFCG